MKKIYLKSMLAAALLSFGCMNASAEEVVDATSAKVKMTYVDYNNPDTIFGICDTITVGYNAKTRGKNDLPEAGSTVPFGRTDWGANYIGYLQVDATTIPGTIQKAVLKARVSNSTDKKRDTGWGVALTDSVWSDQLNYTTTGSWIISKILNNGNIAWTALGNTLSSGEFGWADIELDITDALAGADATGMATIILLETAAAGGYFTQPVVEVTYDPFEATSKVIDFEDGDVSMFSIYDGVRLEISAVDDEALGSKVAKFDCVNRNALPLGLYDFTEMAGQAALVAFDFDFNLGEVAGHHRITIGDALVHNAETAGFSVTSKNNFGYGANGAIFQFGTNRGNLGGGNENFFSINDVAKAASTTALPASDIWGQWLHAKVVVNVQARTVSYVITKGEEVLFEDSGLPFFSDAANACTEFDVSFSNKGTSYIDNLSITSYKSDAVFADYTIKYVDAEGTELKASRSGNGQVGKFVTLVDSDKAPIYAADNSKKYLYDSDDSETTPIAEEGTVITVKFRDAEVYAGVLNCMIEGGSGADARLASFSGFTFFEGDSYYVYPARGYSKDGKFYFTEPTSYNGVVFTFPGSLNYRTVNGVKTYIGQLNYAAVDSVAYYSDFERLALPVEDEGNGTGLGQLEGSVNSWWSFSGGIFDRFSQGRGIRLDANSYVWTEPIAEAGTYLVTIYGRNDVSALCPKPYVLGLRDAEGNVKLFSEIVAPDWGSATTGTNIVENVAIPAGSSLVVYNDGSEIVQDAGNKTKLISLDDISITKTGDYVAPALVSIEDYLIATGIAEVQPVRVNNGVIYNLNGQVVNRAQKGLYIQNGRIIVIK